MSCGNTKHDQQILCFLEDFGVKHCSKEDKDHLWNSLGKTFKYTTDYEGKNYCGLTLKWNYKLGYVDIFMPGYLPRALQRLQYKPKKSPQHSPHTSVRIQYGKKESNSTPQHRNHHRGYQIQKQKVYSKSQAYSCIMQEQWTVPC